VIRRPSIEPIALVPVPAWLAELAGAEVSRAVLSRKGSAYVVHAAVSGASLSFELSGEPVRCARVDRAGRVVVELAREQQAKLSRFVRMLEWLHGDTLRGDEGYRASPREEWIAAVAGQLSSVRSLEEAAELRLGEIDLADPEVLAVQRYVDLVSGAWEPIFDASLDALPSWMRIVLAGASGDVALLRSVASEPIAGPPGLAILAALALELSGLAEHALDRRRAAVDGLAGVQRADLCIELAKIYRARSQRDEAVQWARRALLTRGDEERVILRACFELVRSGALDDAYAVLRERCGRPPVPPSIALALAELLLWAGRPAQARPWLDAILRGPVDARVQRCVGVAHALDGRLHDALAAFERAHEMAPEDMEIAAWLSETHLRLGDAGAARRFLVESRTRVQTPIHTLLAGALTDREAIPYQSELLRLLAALDEPLERWPADPPSAGLAVLQRFGGNRGEMATRLGAAGELGIDVVQLPEHDSVLSSRDAAAETLRLVGTIEPEELDRRFDALGARYPASPHPLCYRGELDLWRGDYERAIRRFDEALERASARWGYVGKAAASIMLGDYDAADVVLARCAEVFTPVRGATTHVYTGEALRRRGEHARAIEELSEAVRAKPGRAGAWMNLALSHLALGAREEAERIFHLLEERLPRLYWDAWRELDGQPRWPVPTEHMAELFEHALSMMRGNRSSHTITYFRASGAMCVARDARMWRTALAKHSSVLATALRSQLASSPGE
jgi:tetratricopeptide (TPR) repeat protein